MEKLTDKVLLNRLSWVKNHVEDKKFVGLSDTMLMLADCYEFRGRKGVRAYEPYIAQNAFCAYLYARFILKGRFLAGEKLILDHPEWGRHYFQEHLEKYY